MPVKAPSVVLQDGILRKTLSNAVTSNRLSMMSRHRHMHDSLGLSCPVLVGLHWV